MAAYFLDVILRENTTAGTSTAFRNGTWTLNPPGYSTIRIEDDDNFGLGDNAPGTETGGVAQVTHIDGLPIPAGHPLAGGIYAKFVRTDDGDGDTDNLADVVVLGGVSSINQSDAIVAYPGSGWSMSVGDSFIGSSSKIPTDHPAGRSWSDEASVGGTPITPPCFTPNSLVQTKRGLIAIQDLEQDDKVVTRDFGYQPLKWKYSTDLNAQWFIANPDLCPIMIKRGALGDGLPLRDSMVSPGHLVLIKDGGNETLIPARQLRNRDGIYQTSPHNTGYMHLLFESHQVIMVDGFWSESFHPSIRSLVGIGPDARSDLFRIFPEMQQAETLRDYTTARPVLYRRAAKTAVARAAVAGALQTFS